MWDFHYAVPSLFILSVFVIYYLSLPRLPIRQNTVFINLVVIDCMVMLLDIISSYVDNNHFNYSYFQLYLVNSAFFVAFFMRAVIFFMFTGSILQLSYRTKPFRIFLLSLPFLIGVVLVLTTSYTHWFYIINETGYHFGPCYNYLYFLFSFYLFMSFYGLFRRRHNVFKKRERLIIFWYNTILTCGLIIRYLFPRFLIMDTFCLIAIIVIFLTFENPEAYLTPRSFIFNSEALQNYIAERTETKGFNCLAFCIRNYPDLVEHYGLTQINIGVSLIEDYLSKEFPGILIFYYRNARFVMTSDKSVDWNSVFNKLHERFKAPWTYNNAEIYLDIVGSVLDLKSVGLPTQTVLHLLIDSYIYAERNLDDTLLVYDDKNIARIIEENNIKRALENAIDNETVEIFLQPIMNAKDFSLAGAEVLSRIRLEDGTIISPARFIPIAEKNGRINQLGKLVFRKCCHLLNDKRIQDLNLSFINVNLSPIQFMRSDLDESLTCFAQDAGADVNFIHLEITEESMIDDSLMEKQITTLTKKGFKFVLDDYGKGYSNMSRLRKTPFINIKLDMSIVWDYCGKPDLLLPTEIKAFNEVGFEITAEGIETEDMAKTMRDIGCTYLQGFYFSKPLPIDEFVAKYSNKT